MIVVMTATIGCRLKAVREELQTRQGIKPNKKTFAKLLGITPASLSDLESGKSKAPASSTLLKIRDRGINPDYIMRGKGPRFLVENVERRLELQKLMDMIEELDDEARKVVTELVRQFMARPQMVQAEADDDKLAN